MKKQPAVFFDRDGVLNKDIGYLYKREEFVWTEGAVDALRYFHQHGYFIFVVTNQSGIARGYYTEKDVQALHRWMNDQLVNFEAGIDAFYYCPHLPEGSESRYACSCTCRKPQPGLVQKALAEWPVDTERSFLVGDKPSDMECARQSGIRGILFPGGNLYDFLQQQGCIIGGTV